jgi:hypothetical protein
MGHRTQPIQGGRGEPENKMVPEKATAALPNHNPLYDTQFTIDRGAVRIRGREMVSFGSMNRIDRWAMSERPVDYCIPRQKGFARCVHPSPIKERRKTIQIRQFLRCYVVGKPCIVRKPL